MKIRYLLFPVCLLLLVGNVRAQSRLVCSNCKVGNNPATYNDNEYTISVTPQIPITDDIFLTNTNTTTSVFRIEGPAAVFTLSGAISGGTSGRVSMLIQGQNGTLILAGNAPNTFSGRTELASGQLILNKAPGVIAIPGDLSLAENNEHSLWCMADNQFNPGIPGTAEYKIHFKRSDHYHRFNLFGTSQTIGGIVSEDYSAVIQHGENSNGFTGPPAPALIVNAWSTRSSASVLTLNGNFNYEYMGSPHLRAADSRQDFVVNKTGTGTQTIENINTANMPDKRMIFNVSAGTLVFQNPNPNPANTTNMTNVTFNCEPGGTIEFRGTGGRRGVPVEYFFGSGCIFKGAGTFKKTGEFSRMSLQSNSWSNLGNEVSITGTIVIEKGILQNIWCNVDWANSGADVIIRAGAAFDVWGNQNNRTPFPTLFDELSGEGKIQNNMGIGAAPYESQLWIGVKDGTSTFAGTIVNNTGNNTPSVGYGGGTLSLTKKGTGTQTLTGNNTYSGATAILGGLLGGTGSILSSAVTVAPGGGIFGGTGTGRSGVFTAGNITFTGTAANPSHVAVYVNNTEATVANALSLIQVGGDTPGSRIGTGTITAEAGVTVTIDFMDPITVADGDYTLISCRNTSALSGTFQVGINNSGCCLAILKNGAGIQVSVKKITITPPTLALCLSETGVSKSGTLNAACSAITAANPGLWSVVSNVNNADGLATAGTATIVGGTVTDGNNPGTITGVNPGSVQAVFTIPASPAGCSGKAIRRVDISTKPVVNGAATACLNSPMSLTGTVGPGATLTGGDWNIYLNETETGISKQIAAGTVANGNPASTGIVIPRAKGTLYVRFFDSNQCPSDPFAVNVNLTAPTLELLSGGVSNLPNTTCPTGTSAENAQPVILAKYATGKPASTAGISWSFTSISAIGLKEIPAVTTALHAEGVTGTYPIQCNTPAYFIYTTAYTLKYTDANACSNTIDLTVTRQPLLTNDATQTAAPTTLCTDGTARFTHINADYPWTWHSSEPAIAKGDQEGISDSPNSETVTGRRAGTTTIYVTDAHGCNSEKLQIVVAAPVITAPSPFLCTTINGAAGSLELATPNESPAGTDNPWSINPANDAGTLVGLSSDKKTIRLEVANTALTAPTAVTVQYNTGIAGCIASKEITINPSPVIDTGAPFAICAAVNGRAGTLTLGSSHEPAGMEHPWAINPANDAAALAEIGNNKKAIRLTAANTGLTAPATVMVQYTGVNGCAGSKTVTINPSPVIDTGAPFTVCADVNGSAGTLQIGSSSPPGPADNPWSFNPATGEADLSDLSADKKTITFTVHDKDQTNVRSVVLQYVDVNGCAGTKIITINPSPKLEVNAGVDLSALCSGASYSDLLSLSGIGGRGTVAWGITGNSINTQVSINNTLTAVSVKAGTTQTAVTHSITFTSGYGCVSNVLSVTINAGVTISLPATGIGKLCHPGAVMQLSASGSSSFVWFSDNEAAATVDAQGLLKSVAAGTAIITAGVAGSNLCAGRQEIVVDDPIVGTRAEPAFDATKLCGDTDYQDVLTLTNGSDQGTWRVYETADAADLTATGTAALWGTDRMSAVKKGSIHTGIVSGTVNRYVAFSQNNCESARLLITIAAPPVMEAVSNRTLCAGTGSGEIALTSAATGDQAADAFTWSEGAVVGLEDNKTNRTASPIPSFTPSHTITSTVTGTVRVVPFNTRSMCEGTATTFSVTVDPVPVVTATASTPMCSGAETNFDLQSNIPDMLYTWTVTANNGVGAADEASKKSDIKQTLTNRGTADVSVIYTITPQTAGGCQGTPVTSTIVVKNTAAVSATATGGGSFCLTPVANGTHGNPRSKPGGTYTTRITPKITPDNPQVTWVYKTTHSGNVSGASSSGTTAQRLTTIQDNLVSTGSDLETVIYSLTPYSGGCVGTETEVKIILKPTPEFTGGENSVPDITFCGGRKVHADLDIRQVAAAGLTKPTGFTWVAGAAGDDIGLADYTDASRPRAKPGPFTMANTNADKHRSITLTPHNADTGCAGLAQTVEIFFKAGPVISPADPTICSTRSKPLLLTTANPGGATNDPTNPWDILSGAEYGSVAYHPGNGTIGDFTPVDNEQTETKTVEVQYTDSNGCTAVVAVAVICPPQIVSFTPATHPDLCAGDTDDTAAATAIGMISTQPGTKYIWSAAKGMERATGSVTVNGAALPIAESTVPEEGPLSEKIKAAAGTDADIVFSVTPSLGGCAGEVKTITVKVLSSGFATRVTPVTNIICSGSAPDIMVGSVDDGNTYTWTTDDRGGSVTGAASQITGVSGGSLINSVLSLPAGQAAKKAGLAKYFITGAHGSCQGAATEVTVEVHPNPTITGAASGIICNNSPTGIVLATDIDAAEADKVKYIWTVNENNLGGTASPAPQRAFTEESLTAAAPPSFTTVQPETNGAEYPSITYTFTAAYGTCAGTPVDIVRKLAFPISMNTVSGGGKACLGDAVTLTANAKGGDITYKWWKNNETAPIDGAVGQSCTIPSDAESNDSYHVSVSNPCQRDISAPAVSVQITKDGFFEGAKAEAAYPSGGATLNRDWVKFTYTPARTEDAANTVYAWDFGDNTSIGNTQNASHLYTTGSDSVTPTLTVKKAGQDACTKKWTLPPIVLLGTSADPSPAIPNSPELQVSPIPARDQITITNKIEMNRITVSDLSGKQVLNAPVTGRRVVVQVNTFSSGLYILTIETGHEVKYVKIIKE